MLDTVNATIVHINAEDLNRALKRTRHAISKEETRYYLNGVFIHFDKGQLHFVAANGHVLARVSIKTDDDLSAMPAVILPLDFVNAAIKATSKRAYRWRDCPLVVTRTKVELHPYEQETITATPIDGTFPDYLRVIPRGHTREFTAKREDLIPAFESVSAFKHATKQAPRIELTFDGQELQALATAENGSARATVKLAGMVDETFILGFNGHYIANILNAMDCHAVTFKLTDPGSPAILAGDDDALHVIMPMRV